MKLTRNGVLAAIVALWAMVALAAPYLGLRDPNAQPDGLVLRDLAPGSVVQAARMADGSTRYFHERRDTDGGVELRRGPRWERFEASELAAEPWFSERYLLGTDGYGRDLLSRLIHGSRVSLAIGFLAAGIALLLGTSVGLAAGLGGGWVDSLLMRGTDLVLSIPRLFLAALLVALYGRSLTATIWILGCTSWMVAARLVRAEILSLRESGFVQAARAAGASRLRIALRHLLPAVTAPLAIEGMLRVVDTILIEASLSFLGLSVPPPHPTWGNMIAEGRDRLLDAWWIATLPGIAVAATVLLLYFVGEAAREPQRSASEPC